MRTRRGRVYYVPWHVRRFDNHENCSYRSGKSTIFWTPLFPTTKASMYVNAFSFAALIDMSLYPRDHLRIILSKLRRRVWQQLLRPLGKLPRFFVDIFVAWTTEMHRSRSLPPPLPACFSNVTRINTITRFPQMNTYESRFRWENSRIPDSHPLENAWSLKTRAFNMRSEKLAHFSLPLHTKRTHPEYTHVLLSRDRTESIVAPLPIEWTSSTNVHSTIRRARTPTADWLLALLAVAASRGLALAAVTVSTVSLARVFRCCLRRTRRWCIILLRPEATLFFF